MTVADLAPLLTQYRAALEAQISMLRHLLDLAARQRDRVHARKPADLLHDIIDERDRVMATLVSLESEITPVRHTLAAARDQLAPLSEFREVVELHREAVRLVEQVVRTDDQSRIALREAELVRRSAAECLERSESTLAAYRRVVMPSVSAATLVNRKG